jgi:hypothetical protein
MKCWAGRDVEILGPAVFPYELPCRVPTHAFACNYGLVSAAMRPASAGVALT